MASSNATSETQPSTLQAIVYRPASSSSSTPTSAAQNVSGSNTSAVSKPTLQILDQLALPHITRYIPITDGDDAYTAIKNMSVRGAPAIAIVAALSVCIDLSRLPETSKSNADSTRDYLLQRLGMLLTSRPTAVNLKDAVDKLSAVATAAAATVDGASADSVARAYVLAAERMLVDDVSDNQAIGRYGADWIRSRFSAKPELKVSVLTHCNTGSLATAGYGTALGIVRSLHADALLEQAYYTETRPYNQGSRLTGYELLHDKIPCTMITDSMAAALFHKSRFEGRPIAAVIVGADRVAANGDTANKIGTYALAVLARHHGVKFLVAAPRTTIDLATPSGEHIVIEERPPEEMLSVRGPQNLGIDSKTATQSVDVENVFSISTAALGTRCWNPAFDVTPADLIDGIVTEVGVIEKDDQGRFQLEKLFNRKDVARDLSEGQSEMPDPVEGP